MEPQTENLNPPKRKWPRRRNQIPAWADAFMEAYRQTGNMTYSARKIGLTRESVWSMYKRNQKFAVLVDAAKEEAIELLEAHAFKRATDKEKPSDILTIFLLKAARPEKYKDCYRPGTPYEQVTAAPASVGEATVIVLPSNGFEAPGTVQAQPITVDVQPAEASQPNGATGENGNGKLLAEHNAEE